VEKEDKVCLGSKSFGFGFPSDGVVDFVKQV